MYEIGDKVLVVGAQSGIEPMARMIGQVCTIEHVRRGFLTGVYDLEEDENKYRWIEQWLEPAEVQEYNVTENDILKIVGDRR